MRDLVYIVGASRSGTSLLENYLHKNSVGLGMGELRWIFKRGILDNDLCSCGLSFNSCKFWKNININKDEAVLYDKLRKKFDNPFNIIFAKLFKWSDCSKELDQYLLRIELFYRKLSTHDVAILDNSKSPFYLYLLLKKLDILEWNITILHFNRDVAGVIESYQKTKIRFESESKEIVTKKNITHALIYWIAVNLVTRILFKGKKNYLYLRYDDFCNNPKNVLEMLNLTKIHNNKLNEIHSISGNPDRITGFGKIKAKKANISNINKKIADLINFFYY